MKVPKKFPDTIIIVLVILVIFVGLTWVIPAGEFEREIKNGREVVVPGSYHRVEPAPQGIGALLTAPIRGFISAAQILAFVFLVGGAFGIMNGTGAINAGLRNILEFSKKHPNYRRAVIPLIMTLFSLAGATFGMSEEVLVFIMITIPLALALGYDSIIGVAMPFVGAGAGFAGAFSNPFTIGIAQEIAGIEMFSGLEYRLIVWTILTLIAITFIMRYAKKIEKKPERSPMYDIDQQRDLSEFYNEKTHKFTLQHKAVLFILLAGIVLLVVGVTLWEWYIQEIAGLFIAIGVISAIIGRMASAEAIKAFLSGAKEMMTAAIVIALTKGMYEVASDGKIIDTILNGIANTADNASSAIAVQIMFLFQGALNFFVPSGSGQAVLTMPIMAPLSDLLGISRQTAVLAFQLGDGLFNMIIPTSGVTMGILAIGKIPYERWAKWIFPLMLIFLIAAMLLLLPPVLYFNWG